VRKYNAKKASEVVDFFGNKVRVDFGMVVKNGTIGIIISDVIEFVGDKFILGHFFEEFQREFKKYYASIAVMESLRAMGYKVGGKELEGGILIEASR